MPLERATRCRGEHTGRRPSAFSRWHRSSLPSWAWACDLDLIEVRHGRGIVAVAEHAQVDGRPTAKRARAIARCKPLQLGVVREVAAALRVPGLFILHDDLAERFGVLDVRTDAVRELDEAGMRRLLGDL